MLNEYFKTDNGILYQGDILRTLKSLPSESVDCILTSPPYYQLRRYSIDDVLWDGDDNCEHEWVDNVRNPVGGKGSLGANVGANKNDAANMRDEAITTKFCSKCGGWLGQLGLEPDYKDFVRHLCDIFDECKRILKPTGHLWVNVGDSYSNRSGSSMNMISDTTKPYGKLNDMQVDRTTPDDIPDKSYMMIPERFAIQMIERGFRLRNKIVWSKPNSMPQSVKDRLTQDFEMIYFFVKNRKYYFNQILEPYQSVPKSQSGDHKYMDAGYMSKRDEINFFTKGGRNLRTTWSINTEPLRDAHFAPFPTELPRRIITMGVPDEVCKKCGKPREKILEHNQLSEECDEDYFEMTETPYAIQEREGFIKIRKLPNIDEFADYIDNARKKIGFTIDKIEEYFASQSPHHWFGAESFPSVDDYKMLKSLLCLNDTYDESLTREYYKPAEKQPYDYSLTGLTDCGCNAGFEPGVVLDIFMGSGTTAVVAEQLKKKWIGIEIGPEYCEIAKNRITKSISELELF